VPLGLTATLASTRSVTAPTAEKAEELARQLRTNQAAVSVTLQSQRAVPKRDRPIRHGGGGPLEMLPPGGANGRMEGDYLAIMGAEDGKNKPKWAKTDGVFAGSSSWPHDFVPVTKEGEERPPPGQKSITVSRGGTKIREYQDTFAPIKGTTLRLGGGGGHPVGEMAVGGVVASGCVVRVCVKVVNTLSSHCKLYDSNFRWRVAIHLAPESPPVAVAVSNPVFYYSVSTAHLLKRRLRIRPTPA